MPAAKTSNGSIPKEWTLMFYFASDNPLAPGIVSQLKSIQQAGFHPEVNVIAQYDPQAERTPVHVFDVNRGVKLQARDKRPPYQIGFKPNDPFVTNLVSDRLWEDRASVKLIRADLGDSGSDFKPPPPPRSKKTKGQEPSPRESLSKFLEFCRKHYPAERYMIFILGHGVVVGNDLFLFDEHAAEHSLSLRNLGRLLRGFKTKIDKDGQRLELVSFHSCSMSALEVAYELKETASYMLAAQGPAFVGSWPYRQILMRVFYDVVKKEKYVQRMFKKIFDYCLFNSRDFQLAGYSFDLCLCDLSKVAQITEPIEKLSSALTEYIADQLVQERILLAHWDAQSYWQESYIDLYDFCLCLIQRCEDAKGNSEEADRKLLVIQNACCQVKKMLEPGDGNLIIRSDIAGSAYQYSHGLSVFFPWSEPTNRKFWPKDYASYQFKATKWFKFLDQYFMQTMRDPRGSESHPIGRFAQAPMTDVLLLDQMASRGARGEGTLGDPPPVGGAGKGGGSDETGDPGVVKGGGSDETGDCGCPSIKNYPPFTLARSGSKKQVVRKPFDCP
jgi:Clostripain family